MNFREKGVQDIFLAASIIGGLFVLNDLLDRKDAEQRQRELNAKLDRIEKGLVNLANKL